ncbi:MAG: tetratricopeptide repeat protein [Desulfobacca sp.]|nr:tetratricopeptide repeat protein [Desulfobacca sp.]
MNLRLIWLAGIALFLGLLFGLIWRQDPDFWRSPHTLYQSAQAATQQGDLKLALSLAEKAYKREPANAGYGTFLGWLYLKAGQPQEALTVFRQVWSRQPTATDSLKGQAQALEQLGNTPAALTLLDIYLATHPDDIHVLQFAADFAGRQRLHRAQALDYYRRLYQLNPRDPLVRRQLLDLLVAEAHYEEAIPLQEAEIADFPDNPQALHQLALLHYWKRDYQAAVPIYQRLLEIEADNQALRLEAAQVADAAQDLDQAINHYLQLYAQEKGKKEHALALARLWSQKGNHAEAAAVLAPLMRDHPDLSQQRWYALELLLAGNHSQALKAYRAAWEAGDTHQETILNLARLYAERRQFIKAAEMWEEAERRQLIRGEQRWEAALTFSYAHRYRQAIKILGPVDRHKHPQIQLFLGQMHFYQKDWKRAADYYQAYLEDHPQDLHVRVQLAEMLSYEPDTLEDSACQYEAALKINDDARLRLKRAAVLIQQAQELSTDREKSKRDLAPQKWAAAEAELRRCPASCDDPEVLVQQARLNLWLGDLDQALASYEQYLHRVPNDRQARLEQVRVLVYLQRGPEALEILRRLPPKEPGAETILDQPGDRDLVMVAIEANLATQNWAEANRWALKLYCGQFPDKGRAAHDWGEALKWSQAENPARPDNQPSPLNPEERTWVARALCHHPDLESQPALIREAVDRLIDNLYTKGITRSRNYHATLLMLAYLMPRLTHYDDLASLVYRIPGINVGSPEYIASLSFFTSKLGRHGGKLDYLLNVLEERRRHYRPRNPADLIYLAGLATELGDRRSADYYYRRAVELRPDDQRLAALKMQNLMVMQDFGQVLKVLESQPQDPATILETAKIYLYRRQYEGAIAVLNQFPASDPQRPQALLMLAQAYRRQGDYPQALQTLEQLEAYNQSDQGCLIREIKNPPHPPLEKGGDNRLSSFSQDGASGAFTLAKGGLKGRNGNEDLNRDESSIKKSPFPKGGFRRISPDDILMEKAQTLEAMADQGAARTAYEEIIRQTPDSQTACVAQARLARVNGNWSRAYKQLAAALQQAPQDRQLLNELEDIRQRMRTQVGARNFPYGRGVRRPEELLRPWQFCRFDREPAVGFTSSIFSLGLSLHPNQVLLPEYSWTSDSNNFYVHNLRLSGSLWLSKVLPLKLAAGYRHYKQNDSILHRAEVSVGLGPMALRDRVGISAEIIGRRYWKRTDRVIVEKIVGPGPITNVFHETTDRDDRNRLLGSLAVNFPLTRNTDASLRYSRQDLFDQEAHLYPRLYQSVLDLPESRLTTLHQLELSYKHQLRPGLEWRGNLGGAYFSDHNRRLTLYQGLAWQAVRQPRMNLAVTPHFYMAAYRQGREAYFSPGTYRALGLGLDFDRQMYRMPTLILQVTGQAVGQHSEWGPALQGLVALEWELVQNFYAGAHWFYFREWVDNYRLMSLGAALRWHF